MLLSNILFNFNYKVKKIHRQYKGKKFHKKVLTREKYSHIIYAQREKFSLLILIKGLRKILKEKRKQQGLSQKELAALAGIDRSLISKIELGVAKPSVKTAKKLAKILKINWTLFF